MAIADTITSMQTHTSNAYTMIGYGTDLTGINKNLENLSRSIFKAFLESLNNPDTLFTNLPKKSGTGANITLNDTANAPMRIELGASEMSQSGTPTPESPQDIHTISGDNTIVVCGANIWNEQWENGGINNNTGAKETASGFIRTKDYTSIEASTTYYRTPSTEATRIFFYTENKTYISNVPVEAVGGTFTTPNNAKYLLFKQYNTTYNNDIAIIKGDSGTYEPYQEQTAQVNLGVKNLYDFRNYKLTNQSLLNRTELIDGSYQFTSTGSGYAYAQYNLSLPAGTYSYKIETDTGSNYTVLNGQTSVSNPFTINETTTIAFRIFIANAVAGNQVVLKNIILEKGTKVQEASDNPIEYCKIGNYEDEFIRTSGKNKCNITGLTPSYYSSGIPSGSSNQIAVDSFDNNNITFHSTSANYNIVLSNVIQLKPNTQYTIKFNRTSTATNNQWFIYDYNNGTYSVNYRDNNTNVYEYTFTTNSLGQIVLAFGHGNTTGTTTISNIMINEGETPLPYEPYGSNEWYIKKNIGKVVLDGSEMWENSGAANTFYTTSITDYAISNNTPMSNYYSGVSNVTGGGGMSAQPNNTIAFINISGQITPRFYVKDRRYENTQYNDFKTWLASNNLIVYYILATPTYTQITGTLAEQLENIYQKLKSFKGTTNISQLNNDLPFVLNVQALENLE